jgi:hypothetical protein
MADEPKANMTLQVRKSLAERLEALVYELKRDHNIRTSKVEVVELVLSGLPDHPSEDLVTQLKAFRSEAPRR